MKIPTSHLHLTWSYTLPQLTLEDSPGTLSNVSIGWKGLFMNGLSNKLLVLLQHHSISSCGFTQTISTTEQAGMILILSHTSKKKFCHRTDVVQNGFIIEHRNDPKFTDRQAWANSVDPDQLAPRGPVWSGSTLFAIPSASFGHVTLR